MKREPCVLLQWLAPDDFDRSGLLIEQLRYAGIVHIVRETRTDDSAVTSYMLEIRAPKGVEQRAWADQNSARMKSFGLNAEASWKEIK